MKGYRIKTVSRVTGLSPELLRAWERRYAVVTPARTPGGYREYSEEDVERLRLLRVLTTRGYAIGEIAGLGPMELDQLARTDRRTADSAAADARRGRHSVVVDHLLGLASEPDPRGLRRALQRTMVVMRTRELAGAVLDPLLAELGDRTSRHDRYRAALALASAEIRGMLGPILAEAETDAPAALVCRGADGTAALPLLRSALCVHAHGGRAHLIDGDASATDARDIARAVQPAAAVLTFERALKTRSFLALLDGWVDALPPGASLVLMGQAVELFQHVIQQRGATFCLDASGLPELLAAWWGDDT